MKVLVTGATGFLGRHVLAALRTQHPDWQPLALVRDRSEWAKLDWTAELGRVELIEGGITGPKAWQEDPRLDGVGAILHLAAVVRHSRHAPADMYEANVDGTLRMVRLAAKYQARMVYVSTSGTVGCFKRAEQLADEDAPYVDRTVARWPYYDSKIQAERRARALAGELQVPLTIVRPPILLGPGDHKFRSTGNVIRFLRRRLPFLIDGGMHFTDVRDAAAAIVRAIDHPAQRPAYHLPGTMCTVGEFFRMCQEVSGVPTPQRMLPSGLAWSMASAAERAAAAMPGAKSPLPDPVVIEMGTHWWGLSSRHAEAELGYAPRPGRQTLADTILWLRQHHPQLKAEAAAKVA
jgi:nucleoside-diphosphate-sugar epimerase